MRVMLIGYRGQLGCDLRKEFENENLTLVGQEEMQVQNEEQVKSVVANAQPELILNCSAFHRVDDCEDQPEQAFEVNVYGVRNLALAAREADATLVHFSTDYVYDGPRRTPYTEADIPCPSCVYGVSKASGEMMLQSIWRKHFICRVSGLYGYAGSREKKSNFVEMMIGLAKQGKPIRVVNDQVLTPTSTRDVAAKVRDLVTTDAYGIYHMTNSGWCSWHDFAAEIFAGAGLKPELTPVTSDAFPTKARRPSYSVLENARLQKAGLGDMRSWQEALADYLAGRSGAGRN